jgi:hypothetical protein
MFTIAKAMLRVLFLALVVAGPMACLTINKSPDDQPKTQVNVGGSDGVTVNKSSDGQPRTEVNVGGSHGVTVDHDKDNGN